MPPFAHPVKTASTLALVALILALSACGKEGSNAGNTPDSTGSGPTPSAGDSQAANPAPGASSGAAAGVTNNGGLPASQLGSMPTSSGSKNSSPNNSTGNATR